MLAQVLTSLVKTRLYTTRVFKHYITFPQIFPVFISSYIKLIFPTIYAITRTKKLSTGGEYKSPVGQRLEESASLQLGSDWRRVQVSSWAATGGECKSPVGQRLEESARLQYDSWTGVPAHCHYKTCNVSKSL